MGGAGIGLSLDRFCVSPGGRRRGQKWSSACSLRGFFFGWLWLKNSNAGTRDQCFSFFLPSWECFWVPLHGCSLALMLLVAAKSFIYSFSSWQRDIWKGLRFNQSAWRWNKFTSLGVLVWSGRDLVQEDGVKGQRLAAAKRVFGGLKGISKHPSWGCWSRHREWHRTHSYDIILVLLKVF